MSFSSAAALTHVFSVLLIFCLPAFSTVCTSVVLIKTFSSGFFKAPLTMICPNVTPVKVDGEICWGGIWQNMFFVSNRDEEKQKYMNSGVLQMTRSTEWNTSLSPEMKQSRSDRRIMRSGTPLHSLKCPMLHFSRKHQHNRFISMFVLRCDYIKSQPPGSLNIIIYKLTITWIMFSSLFSFWPTQNQFMKQWSVLKANELKRVIICLLFPALWC